MSKTRLFAMLTLFSLAVLCYSALPLLAVDSASDGGPEVSPIKCCRYSFECPADYCCMTPEIGEAPCSPHYPNYCRRWSSPAAE